MRLIFWVTALAVLSITCAKNSTAKSKPKRQLESLRTPQSLQYSLVLPHSRVTHFRSLTSDRRISNIAPRGGKLPPYAVQMEPVVQYSQKDPLYDPNLDNLDDVVVNKNEIYAQPKILNIHEQVSESRYGPPYGALPTAPLYSHEPPHPHYYEAPEPIIEIIIKESNESLPAPPPTPVQKKKKEPVHVFYVKYSKDPHHQDKVIYEKPIPAITPPTNEEDDHHHEDYITVTPEPLYIPQQTTTLRAIIKPESELYHSDSSVKITFGNEGRHYSDRREGNLHIEGHEETAPRPAIAFPQQPLNHPPLERSVSPKPQTHKESPSRPVANHPTPQTYRPVSQHAQSRIQFQQPYLHNEQQLPRQGPSVSPFRAQQNIARQNPFGASPSISPHPSFSSGPPVFGNNAPTVPGPIGPAFPTSFPRPSNGPSFHSRPSNPPPFGTRTHFNGPPRTSFHAGPQRPFHQPQPQQFFDEPKYLQENYHTITTEQVEPTKDQPLPSRHQQNFNLVRPSPSPTPAQFQEHQNRPQLIPLNQQLPQQRPHQHFSITPSRTPFFNLKPSPPKIEDNRPPFQQHQQQQFSFHQGPQPLSRPSVQISSPQFSGSISASPSPISQNQFLPHPSSPTLFNFHPQPSPTPENHFQQSFESERPQFQQSHGLPERSQFQQSHGPSERPQFHQQHSPSERPQFQQSHGPSERPQFQQSQGPTERPQFQQQHGPSERPQFQQQHGPSERPQFQQQHGLSERPQFSQSHSLSESSEFQQSHGPSERPQFQHSQGPSEQPSNSHHNSFRDQSNFQHQQNVGQFVPNGGELVAAIPKYEQHITVNGPTAQPSYNGLSEASQPTPTASQPEHQHLQQQHHQQQQQHHHHHQQQQQEYHQQQQQQLRQQQHQQQLEYYDAEQEQVRQQLAKNVQKQQEEIQRLQSQLVQAQHQHQQQEQEQQNQQQSKTYEQNYVQTRNNYNQQQVQATSPKSQYSQERSRPQPSYVSSTSSPPYYQSTSRTVEIKPTTQKYSSSTLNTISSTPEAKKDEKKKRPAVELPDEVPDDLRQQLLSSGILDNADISILDYDKVGDTPLDSLPPDQLANFFSAGGGQQIASSEHRPIIVTSNGERIQSRIDDDDDEDQEIAASENLPSYVAAPPSQKQAVEMKVVHFDPKTAEGQNIAQEYVKEDATHVDPVALNDKKYNRYLPLKVSGNQFPLPDILKGRKVTSVVVLAPVETEALNGDHTRAERAASNGLKGIKFIAGESLQDLLKRPSKDNFEKWLEIEKNTASDLQSVVLLVTGNDDAEKEIYMYDISSGNVNKLSGELSNAFVEAAENNSLSKDIEKLAIEGDGTPEQFNKDSDEKTAEASENVPLLVDLSGVSLDENSNQVSISSGYSKTKLGRSIKRH